MQHFGLYDPANERDSCGVGFVANINGTKEHSIVEKGLEVLMNLVHRGAIGGDLKTGDGAGILTQLPERFFREITPALGFELPEAGRYGVAMLFLSPDPEKGARGLNLVRAAVNEGDCAWLGEREVPVDASCLGELALVGMPRIVQVFIGVPEAVDAADTERRLYLVRKIAERNARGMSMPHGDFYCCSLSSRTIVYKGLFTAPQIKAFFPDLADPRFESALALVHQRYSTNTFPTWSLAQPFRFLAHNGEINTLRGNINKMRAREAAMSSPVFGDDLHKLLPIVDEEGSDSAVFDNVFELLVRAGRGLDHSMMMMVPEAFGVQYHISQDKRAFYEYHANIMEPWDGPAALVFSDGTRIGATLDRNGLRPCRYTLTRSGFIVLASECGVLEIDPAEVLRKGRLMPGKMFIIDLEQGRMLDDVEIKSGVSRRKPYRHWLEKNRIEVKGLFGGAPGALPSREEIRAAWNVFGYSCETVEDVLTPMALDGQEPVNSMGTDVSLAVLSAKPVSLFRYFKQLFAQVTNPPIDPIREGLVMSLMSFLGPDYNLLDETPQHCRKLKLPHPILSNEDLDRIKQCTKPDFRAVVLQAVFPVAGAGNVLERALEQLFHEAKQAIKDGAAVLVLSHRGVDEQHAPLPILLAAAGVHHELIRSGLRSRVGLVVESGEPCEVHHFALLFGYGVNAVNPYLALDSVSLLAADGTLGPGVDRDDALKHYVTAVKKGLLKIFSKMGISTLRSYNAAQIFEAVGIAPEVIERYFSNTASRIGGIGLDGIQREAFTRHQAAYARAAFTSLPEIGGLHRVRVAGEDHLWTPLSIKFLQGATRNNDHAMFKQYSAAIDNQAGRLCTLRGLFRLKPGKAIPLGEVEPAEEIFKRFATGAMSFGSISREAHTALAAAMNELGGKSNTGEGGEEAERFLPRPDGSSFRSAIKQVASGRFGVTAEYLVNADEIQIKMAQGAKPGEGGQLPGHKVDTVIAAVRHSTPGVTLISPPPHHDIYSIEDLAQLIFDLRSVNPRARISVKLVAEVGVGTVAAGVAKAKADTVLVSGHDGGTGASPVSSILHAGIPWELGLAETQHTLVRNHLRDKIRVQTDGQMKTGRDVVVAALLGAEEFGFATAPLVTLGCIMMRKCHQNSCPVGVATQDPELRKRFSGKAEYVVRFFRFIAEEVREAMAGLGFRTMDEMIGRSDMLEIDPALLHWKAAGLDLSTLLSSEPVASGMPLRCTVGQVHEFPDCLDFGMIEQAAPALEKRTAVRIELPVRNAHRTVGAMLSGEVAKRHGAAGLPDDTIVAQFTGSAGQSFGAFLSPGITFRLEGEANDYLGKGLSGGRICVVPPAAAGFRAEQNTIVGNTLLYGATSGSVYVCGMAGERFAVRNSGATAVVEGVGDHGCEYMTGGLVIVLGPTGRNFAAGMSGGIAFVLDQSQLFDTLCNLDMVDLEPVADPADVRLLRGEIENHQRHTGSRYAAELLESWEEVLPRFVKVMPIDYRKALEAQRREESHDSFTVPVTEEVFPRHA